MAEELRFFLRTAVYTVIIAIVYWFLSYETAGSVMLAFVSLATTAVVTVGFLTVAETHDELDPGSGSALHRIASIFARLFGFSQARRATAEEPLATELNPIPSGSIWPLTGGIAVVMAGLGIVYGPWLVGPALALGVLTVWGWLTQMDAPH